MIKKYLFLFVLLVLCSVNVSFAEYSSIPNSLDFPLPDNAIFSIIDTDDRVYIGGSQNNFAGKKIYGGIPVYTDTGLLATSSAEIRSSTNITDGKINFSLPDSSGGWYIGGSFGSVNFQSVTNIAHILSDGTLDTDFLPSLNGVVNSMVLSDDGLTLYIGGTFTTVGGVTYNRLAAINTADGTASTTFNPNMGGEVKTITLSPTGDRLYAGGSFTTVGGVTYNRLAAINTADGTASTTFNPNINSTVNDIVLSSDGSALYIGGDFTTVGGVARNYISAINTSNGSRITTFSPTAGSNVKALALLPDDSIIYVGMTGGGGPSYSNYLSAYNTSDGSTVTGFPTGTTASAFPSLSFVNDMVLSSDGSRLYVGGLFNKTQTTEILGTKAQRLVVIDTDTNTVLPFLTDSTLFSNEIISLSLSEDDSTLYVAPYDTFSSSGSGVVGTLRSRIYAINKSDGELVSDFDPSNGYFSNGNVTSMVLSPDESILYVGGTFTSIASTTKNYLTAFNTSDGSFVSTFNPSVGGTINTMTLSSDGSVLYIGGLFTTVGGVTYNRLAAINTADGSVISTFNPNMNGEVKTILLSHTDDILYAGGSFTTVGGVTYNRLAAINTADGSAIDTFNPNVGSTVRSIDLTNDSSALYVGGDFTTVGGVTYNRLAAINTADGTASTTFNPDLSSFVYSLALSGDEQNIYVGGNFTTVNSQSRVRFASLSVEDGSLNFFNPSSNATVNFILPTESRLYLSINSSSGFIYNAGLYSTQGFASFPIASTLPSETSISINEGSSGSYTIVLGGEPLYDVEISLTASGDGISISPDVLTFTSSNWDTPQTIDISITGNSVVDGNRTATISHVATSTDESFAENSISDVTVNIIDDDVERTNRTSSSASSRVRSLISQGNTELAQQIAQQYNLSIDTVINCPSGMTCTPVTPPSITPTTFPRNLTVTYTGPDVKTLQQYLNSKGFTLALTGPGSPGNETNTFGALTRSALARFQSANGITPAVGYLGPITRAFIQSNP